MLRKFDTCELSSLTRNKAVETVQQIFSVWFSKFGERPVVFETRSMYIWHISLRTQCVLGRRSEISP